MTIYIDPEYKCYLTGADDRIAVETDFFDGKCAELIEGYRYVPEGAIWEREDGMVFYGLMVTPWKPYAELLAAQMAYELECVKAELAEADEALREVGVTWDET